jgi:hypothetical protein
MLAPRVFRIPSTLPTLRAFTTSAVQNRAPSIRDLTPDSAEQFNARQKEFRENLEAARRQKEQQESQSVNASASSSSSSSSSTSSQSGRPTESTASHIATNVSNASDNLVSSIIDAAESLDPKALGSLSTHRIIGQSKHSEEGQGQKRGPLSSLIYGTKEGQHFDKDIERSFSQVLARGKYVHSVVFHEVKPDRIHEYVDLVGEWYPKMAGLPENKVNLVGSWRTQVGDNDTFGMLISPSHI